MSTRSAENALPRVAALAPAPAVLVVDDDRDLGLLVTRWLAAAGHRVVAVTSAAEALEAVAGERPGVVVTDLMMCGMDGLALASELHRRDPLLPVVMLSATGSVPDAVRAMHMGLSDFLVKPVSREVLLAAVEASLAGASARAATFGEQLVYRSRAMVELVTQAARVAAGSVTALITGETGTGKEVLARAIHDAGPRGSKPFVAVNCGAIPEHLLESELFGHERGAFTGALTRHDGLFRAAHGGTLFLDEVGDMPLALQVKLLRVLQDFHVRAVGATRSEAVDVRILAATHNDLPRAIAAGAFREDLYYRLNVVPLAVPPLRERLEDIPLLAERFLARLNARSGGPPRRLVAEAEALLMGSDWPGNVRQLANVVEQCHTLSPSARIPASLVERALRGSRSVLLPLKEARDAFERGYLERVLRASLGNVTRAARLAGRNRTEFYKLLGYHGLDARDYRLAGESEEPGED